jgi:hypothetical protein
MISLDENLKTFFIDDIFDDEDEVDKFLSQYACEYVIQSLMERLKSLVEAPPDIAHISDTAWRLGRTFSELSERYAADKNIYALIDTCNDFEKISLLNFFSGYWDQSKADPNVLMGLTDILQNVISNELKWPDEVTAAGIDAVAMGYGNNKEIFTKDMVIKNNLSEKLKLFKRYLSDSLKEYPNRRPLIELLDRVNVGWVECSETQHP